MKFNRIKVLEDSIFVDKNQDINFVILYPFDNSNTLNFYYHKLAYLLEKETNRLVFTNLKGDTYACNKESLASYLKISRQNMDNVFRTLAFNGILMQIKCYGKNEYYINPRFAINGIETSQTLLRIFKYDHDTIYGENCFSVPGTPYEKIEKFDVNKFMKIQGGKDES